MKVTPNSPLAAPSPKIKKSRNNKTPTPQANAKALFNTPLTSTQNQQMINTTEKLVTPMPKVTGTQQLATKALLENTAKSPKTAVQALIGAIQEQDTWHTTPSIVGQQEAQEDQAQKEQTATNKTQTTEIMQVNNAPKEEDTKQATPEEPTGLSPKEWQCKHDLWLHYMMWAAVGDELAPDCEEIDKYKEVHRGVFDNEIDVTPRKEHVNRYNLHITVETRENQVKLFHKAFCKWYLKMHKPQFTHGQRKHKMKKSYLLKTQPTSLWHYCY